MLSAAELKKPVAKRAPKNQSLLLSTAEPWDTMKAQLLVKIDIALKSPTLSFDDYGIMFYIPRVLPKPGMTLATEADYTSLLEHIQALVAKMKIPAVNINISQNESSTGKENLVDSEDEGKKESKSKKKVCICIVYRNPDFANTFGEESEGSSITSWQYCKDQQYTTLARTMEVRKAPRCLHWYLLLPPSRNDSTPTIEP